MDELAAVKAAVKPQEILLVVDAMTGQDAVTVADTFNKKLAVDGVILTKLDGDTRGGAALSVRAVTGKPIKFCGIAEKMDGIEPFYPDRMASRILGMGDMLSLIEKAQESFDEEAAAKLEKKARNATFNLEDYLDQMQQMKKMGSMKDVSEHAARHGRQAQGRGNRRERAEKAGSHHSFHDAAGAPQPRHPQRHPARRRIAAGAGVTVQDVNQLVRQFDQAKQMMKQMMGGGGKFLRRRMKIGR